MLNISRTESDTNRLYRVKRGWTETQFATCERYKLALGVTTDGDLIRNATRRTLNRTLYVGNRLDLGSGLSIYANAEFWNTEYLSLGDGDAMRLKTVLIRRF